jgi:transcriptional regulator with XRE-family HTH domain
LRKEHYYKQSDIAEMIGVGRTTYAKYETGDIQPPTDQIVKLSDLFSVSTDYLLGKSNNPIPPDRKKVPPSAGELLRQFLEISGLSKKGKETLEEQYDMLRRCHPAQESVEASSEMHPRLGM